MASWEFSAAGPITAEMNLPSGNVNLTASQSQTITVSLLAHHGWGNKGAEKLIADTQVAFEGGTLTVSVPKRVQLRSDASLDLAVGLPEGSWVSVRTASADVSCAGELGSLDAHLASGDVHAERVSGQAGLTTASGDAWLEDGASDVMVKTASGDARVGRAGGDISVRTASGDVRIGEAGQSVDVNTASGDVRIDSVSPGRTEVTTVSGDVVVAVPSGIGVFLDISAITGHVSSDLDSDEQARGGDDAELTLQCRSISGDVRVTRASLR